MLLCLLGSIFLPTFNCRVGDLKLVRLGNSMLADINSRVTSVKWQESNIITLNNTHDCNKWRKSARKIEVVWVGNTLGKLRVLFVWNYISQEEDYMVFNVKVCKLTSWFEQIWITFSSRMTPVRARTYFWQRTMIKNNSTNLPQPRGSWRGRTSFTSSRHLGNLGEGESDWSKMVSAVFLVTSSSLHILAKSTNNPAPLSKRRRTNISGLVLQLARDHGTGRENPPQLVHGHLLI